MNYSTNKFATIGNVMSGSIRIIDAFCQLITLILVFTITIIIWAAAIGSGHAVLFFTCTFFISITVSSILFAIGLSPLAAFLFFIVFCVITMDGDVLLGLRTCGPIAAYLKDPNSHVNPEIVIDENDDNGVYEVADMAKYKIKESWTQYETISGYALSPLYHQYSADMFNSSWKDFERWFLTHKYPDPDGSIPPLPEYLGNDNHVENRINEDAEAMANFWENAFAFNTLSPLQQIAMLKQIYTNLTE